MASLFEARARRVGGQAAGAPADVIPRDPGTGSERKPAVGSQALFIHPAPLGPTLFYSEFGQAACEPHVVRALDLDPKPRRWPPSGGRLGFVIRPDAGDQAGLQARISAAHPPVGDAPSVLSIAGSDLRLGWLRRKLYGIHVLIDSDPLDLFAAVGATDWIDERLALAQRNLASRLFDYPASLAGLREPGAPGRFHGIGRRRAARAAAPEAAAYAILFHAWLLRFLHGLSFADLVVDQERIANEPHCAALDERIAASTGLRLAIPAAGPDRAVDGPADHAGIEREVLDCLPMSALEAFIDRARIGRRIGEISPRKAAMLDRIL